MSQVSVFSVSIQVVNWSCNSPFSNKSTIFIALINFSKCPSASSILLDTMFELPSLEGVEEVVINAEVAEGRARPLYTYTDGKKASETSA